MSLPTKTNLAVKIDTFHYPHPRLVGESHNPKSTEVLAVIGFEGMPSRYVAEPAVFLNSVDLIKNLSVAEVEQLKYLNALACFKKGLKNKNSLLLESRRVRPT